MGLFSTTHVHNHDNSIISRSPERIDVHEHRAPTDESIKLYKELEDKARRNIIGEVFINDNSLNGVAIAYSDGFTTSGRDDIMLFLKFKVNNKEIVINETISRFDIKNEIYKLDMKIYLHDRLKTEIAVAITKVLYKQILEQIQNI